MIIESFSSILLTIWITNWHCNGGGDDDDNDNDNDNYNDNEGYIVWIMNWHYWVLNLGILSRAGEGAGPNQQKSTENHSHPTNKANHKKYKKTPSLIRRRILRL